MNAQRRFNDDHGTITRPSSRTGAGRRAQFHDVSNQNRREERVICPHWEQPTASGDTFGTTAHQVRSVTRGCRRGDAVLGSLEDRPSGFGGRLNRNGPPPWRGRSGAVLGFLLRMHQRTSSPEPHSHADRARGDSGSPRHSGALFCMTRAALGTVTPRGRPPKQSAERRIRAQSQDPTAHRSPAMTAVRRFSPGTPWPPSFGARPS